MSNIEELRTQLDWLEFATSGKDDEITMSDLNDVVVVMKDMLKEIIQLRRDFNRYVESDSHC